MKAEEIRKTFDGLFGMCEMECAAARILERTDGVNQATYPEVMQTQHEVNGFCHLIESGYLESCGHYNGTFKWTDVAVQKLNSRGQQLGVFEPQT